MTHHTLSALARRAAVLLLLLAVPPLAARADDEPGEEARGTVRGTVTPG